MGVQRCQLVQQSATQTNVNFFFFFFKFKFNEKCLEKKRHGRLRSVGVQTTRKFENVRNQLIVISFGV
jgi:hypothetical protein